MRKLDHILWHILATTGLNYVNIKLSPLAKCFRMLLIIGFMISLIYIRGEILLYIERKLYKEVIIRLLSYVYSGIIWCIAYSKRRAISYIVLQVYQKQTCYNTSKKTKDFIVMSVVIVALVITFVSCVLNIISNFEIVNNGFSDIGIKTEKKILMNILIISIQVAVFEVFPGFLFLLTICLSILFYRCSELLFGYKTFIRIQLHTISKGTIENYIEFFHIIDLLRKLNKALSSLSFFIILCYLQSILNVIITSSLQGIFEFHVIDIADFACNNICNVVLFIYFTICSSLIPENIIEIQSIVKNFVNIHRYSHFISEQDLFYLTRIENADVVYISVGGMFNVTRSYIMTVLGLMFTYGLVIINLNF